MKVLPAFWLTIVLLGLSPTAGLAQSGAVNVDDARTALKKWVEIRRLLSQEKRDWALAKEVLNERIDLVQHELETQRNKIGETEASIAEADEKLAELLEENATLTEALSALENTVSTLETRTFNLLQRLPDPIREADPTAC